MSYLQTFGSINTFKGSNSFFSISTKLLPKEYSGIYIIDTVYQEIKFGDVLYYDRVWKAWGKSIANNSRYISAKGIAVQDSLATYSCKILLKGSINNPKWKFDITTEPTIYLSYLTSGDCTTTIPTLSSIYRVPIGLVQSPTQGYFHFYGLWMYNYIKE